MQLWSYVAGLLTVPMLWLVWVLAQAVRWAVADSWRILSGGLKPGYQWWTYVWAAPALLFVHFARYLIDRANGVERVR